MTLTIHEIRNLAKALDDETRSGFFRRWRAAKRLAQLASAPNGTNSQLGPEEARSVVEGLVTGLEGVHWGLPQICKRALEGLKVQALIEAVCDVLLERDLPRLRALAVHGRYEPQDPVRRAAYLFVLGRLQFYEAHDQDGALLEEFYRGASPAVRDRLLGFAQSWGDQRLRRLVASILRQGGSSLRETELTVLLATVGQPQFYAKHDPKGALLEQFYAETSESVQDRLLRAPRDAGDSRWVRLVMGMIGSREGAGMREAETQAAVEVLSAQQRWEELWALATTCPLPWSWRAVQALAQGGWQPQEQGAVACWRELAAAVQTVSDPAVVAGLVGQRRAVLRGHKGGVCAVALSPDGLTLVSGSEDRSIIVWDLPTGQQRAVLHEHKDWVTAVALSPDGQTLVSGSDDKTIIFWDLWDASLLERELNQTA